MIRPEQSGDIPEIRTLITAAFLGAAFSDGEEATIVDRLRENNALAVSLVAELDGTVVGHVAFSLVAINGIESNWFGLGPVAVRPDHQRQGIGTRLIEAGLDLIRSLDAAGCVVLGDPGYYSRFGFRADPSLIFPGVPPEYFQCLDFIDNTRHGVVVYHDAFYGTQID